jgi:hypothetical protein
MRLDALKEQDGNIHVAKAHRLIDELILRKKPELQAAEAEHKRISSGLRRARDAGTKRRSHGDSTSSKGALNRRRRSATVGG